MRLRIVSDGTAPGTMVMDEDTGERLELVRSVRIEATIEGGVVATIEILNPQLDIIAEQHEDTNRND